MSKIGFKYDIAEWMIVNATGGSGECSAVKDKKIAKKMYTQWLRWGTLTPLFHPPRDV